jgi:molybdate transport system substrate-binding protein
MPMTKTLAAIVAFGLTLTGSGAVAAAAEIKVVCPVAMKSAMDGLIGEFEHASSHKVTVAYGPAGPLLDRVQKGEAVDVVILTGVQIAALLKQGKIVAASQADIAKVGIGVAVRPGADRPDIGSVDAFKSAMLAAKSISYVNPANGGSAGIYLAGMFEHLGIAAEMKPKTVLVPGQATDSVINGTAAIAITQMSEIMAEPKVELVGPLPAAIQNVTLYSGGVAADSKEPEAAAALMKFLASPATAAVLKAKGLEAE